MEVLSGSTVLPCTVTIITERYPVYCEVSFYGLIHLWTGLPQIGFYGVGLYAIVYSPVALCLGFGTVTNTNIHVS